jgi:hypothetical protein
MRRDFADPKRRTQRPHLQSGEIFGGGVKRNCVTMWHGIKLTWDGIRALLFRMSEKVVPKADKVSSGEVGHRSLSEVVRTLNNRSSLANTRYYGNGTELSKRAGPPVPIRK